MLPEKLADSMRRRLELLYGSQAAPDLLSRIEGLLEGYEDSCPQGRRRDWDQRDVLLISYADSLLGDAAPLGVLREFLAGEVGELVSFLHLLPFYPYSSDDGFAVEDFRAVREDLGGWKDVAALASRYRLVFDAVINHVSASSTYMQGYAAGDEQYDDFFIALSPQTDTSSVLRTRNLPLLHEYQTCRGTEWLWTTFSRDQLDLNYANPDVLLEILDVLLFYAARGASVLRLDAIPYLWKKLGSSCAHLPETHEMVKLIRDVLGAVAPHVLLLTETNVPHEQNVSYFGTRGDEAQMIYNFCLPPLVLHAIHTGDATKLTSWASSLEYVSPQATYLNITATHDGIGMRPTEGLLSEAERGALVKLARRHGGEVTSKQNSDGSESPYELNINYFDALNDPRGDDPFGTQISRFMLSQAIPLALMGIPGIYIHSLLGSRGDFRALERTGRARSINRGQLSVAQLAEELADENSLRACVLRDYRRLLSVRRKLSAFHPDAEQQVLDLGPGIFALRRCSRRDGRSVLAVHNLTGRQVEIDLSAAAPRAHHADLLTGGLLKRGELRKLPLAPYQFRWLTPLAGLHA
jgi:glucosylglycerate phosphorylase